MGIEPEHPEIPMPLPPGRQPPPRTDPLMVPVVTIGTGDAWERLSEQRRILVNGPLDHDAVTTLSAELMAFDGASSRNVEIVINSPGGPVAEVFPVLDVLDLMRAKVHATVIGSAIGTAVAVVASVTGLRRAAPNAVFGLRIDDQRVLRGAASDIARTMIDVDATRSRYVTALAAATGLDAGTIEAELDRGEVFDSGRARAMGIIDSVSEPATARR